MTVSIDTAWILAAVLATLRIGGTLMFTSVLGFSSVPTQIRLLLVLALSLSIFAALPVTIPAGGFHGLLDLTLAALNEITLGAAMAFGVMAVFAAFSVGGKLLDYQMGFGIASLFDPATQAQSSLNGTFLGILGAVTFLAVDAHYTVLKALAYSFSVIPLGHPAQLPADALVAHFGLMFSFGFMLVAPPVIALMLIDLATGVASRLMPQVSAYFIVLPVKILVGIAVTAISLRYMQPFIVVMFDAIFRFWRLILPAA
ncbi:MAG: flagellar biosynthetic protein FliR [Solimonas sp.]